MVYVSNEQFLTRLKNAYESAKIKSSIWIRVKYCIITFACISYTLERTPKSSISYNALSHWTKAPMQHIHVLPRMLASFLRSLPTALYFSPFITTKLVISESHGHHTFPLLQLQTNRRQRKSHPCKSGAAKTSSKENERRQGRQKRSSLRKRAASTTARQSRKNSRHWWPSRIAASSPRLTLHS